MRQSRSNRGGFTLLELMVVIVLIAITSGLIMAEMRGTMEEALLRSTARRLMDGANLAHARAIALNEPCVLTLDLANHRYTVHRNARDEAEGVRQIAELSGGDDGLDERIRIELIDGASEETASPDEEKREPRTIRFFPDGTADPADILLRDRAGGELRLRVSPSTARLRAVESAEP